MCKKTHVPDKLEGYMLQVRHALYNLIAVDDGIVSVEAFDDVAVETETALVAEQTKSVLSNNNPVTNKAVVFWKTIYNWSQYINNEDFSSKQLILRYVVVSSHELSVGTIPNSFFNAKNETDAKKAMASARSELYDKANVSPKVSKECKSFVEYCFSPDHESAVIKTIVAMELELHENSYDDELKKKFARQPIPPEYVEELLIAMLGWVQNKIHEFTKENKPAYIVIQEYRDALIKETRGRNTSVILSAVSTELDNAITDAEVDRHDTYIKQLEYIELDPTDIFGAASDFLRTKTEIIAWADKGLVTEQSFDDYHNSLKRIWKNEKRLNDFSTFSNDVQKGQALYSKCDLTASSQLLQGKAVPSFFGSGSLHSLANEPSDKPEIGWHPDYIALLKECNDE